MKRLIFILFIVSGLFQAEIAFSKPAGTIDDFSELLKSSVQSVLYSPAPRLFDNENEDFDFENYIEINEERPLVLNASHFFYIVRQVPLPMLRILFPSLLDLPPPFVS